MGLSCPGAKFGYLPIPAAPHGVDAGLPILGICYGQQTMCSQLGGVVEAGLSREFGQAEVEVVSDSLLLKGLAKCLRQSVWMSHGDHVSASLGF